MKPWGWSKKHSEQSALSKCNVPGDLHPLLQYAEVWGSILEEAERNKIVDNAPFQAVRNLHDVVSEFEPALTAWLNGPDIHDRTPTREYVAFSALLMAFDYAKLKLQSN